MTDRPTTSTSPSTSALSRGEKEMRSRRRLAVLKRQRQAAQSPKAQDLLDEAIRIQEAVTLVQRKRRGAG